MTPFDDLASFIALPRVTGLRLAPDGSWLAVSVQQPDPDGKKFSSAIWRVPAEAGPDAAAPVRLTRSAPGEDSPVFLPDGSLLFTSRRPDPAAGTADTNGDDPKPALWLLPAEGGEARRIAAPPGGVSRVATARGGPGLVFMSPMLAGAAGQDEDVSRRQRRKDTGVTAILHEAAPVRYWDHDLGPDEPRLLTATAADGGLAGPPRDLTPQPGRSKVSWVTAAQTTSRPSGEMCGSEKSRSGAASSTRRAPVAVSMTVSSSRRFPGASHTTQPVTAAEPSGARSADCSSSARPGCGVRSRGGPASPPSAAVAVSSRGSSGPRS